MKARRLLVCLLVFGLPLRAAAQDEIVGTFDERRASLGEGYSPCAGPMPPGVRFDGGDVVLDEPLVHTRRVRLPLSFDDKCGRHAVTLRPRLSAELRPAPGPNAVDVVVDGSPAAVAALRPPVLEGHRPQTVECVEGRCVYRYQLDPGEQPTVTGLHLPTELEDLRETILPGAPDPVFHYAFDSAGSTRITALPSGFTVCGGTALPITVEVPANESPTEREIRTQGSDGECRATTLRIFGPALHTALTAADVSVTQGVDERTVILSVRTTAGAARRQLQFQSLDAPATGRWTGACAANRCPYELRFASPPGELYTLSLWAHGDGVAGGPALYAADGAELAHRAGYALEVSEWTLPSLDMQLPLVTTSGTGSQATLPPHAAFRFVAPTERHDVDCGARRDCGTAVRQQGSRQLAITLDDPATNLLRAAGGSVAITIPATLAGAGKTLTVTLRTIDCRYSILPANDVLAGSREAEVYFYVFASARECVAVPLQIESSEDRLVLGETSWDASRPGLVTADVWPSQAGRGEVVRRLHVRVASTAELDEQRVDLTARFAAVDRALLGRHGRALGLALNVREPLELAPATVDVQLGANRFLEGQPVLIQDHANFVRFDVPAELRTHTRLVLRDRLHGACANAEGGDWLEAQVPDTPGGLPSSTFASGSLRFCVLTRGTASELRVRSIVSGALAQLGRALDAPAALTSGTVRLGRTEHTLALPTRELHQPWHLPDRVRMVCDEEVREGAYVGHQQMPRPLLEEQYRSCRLFIDLPDEIACDRANPGAVFAEDGRQHLLVTARSGEATWDVDALVLSRESGRLRTNVTCHGRGTISLGLDSVLEQAPENLDDYARITLEVRHAPQAQRVTGLRDAHVPDAHRLHLDEVAQLRTRLRPRNGITGLSDYHTARWGVRVLAGVGTGVSFFRSPSSGRSSSTSSGHDAVENVSFNYGLLMIIEPWDFANNEGVTSFINPQFHIGILAPTSFDRETVFHSMSVVVGGGIRLPTSTAPTSDAPTMQSSLTFWYELSAGERELHHAFLLGINVMIALTGD